MKKYLEDLVSEKMIAYGSYVLEDRALIDIRDGLKPVQRKVLYNMYSHGTTPDKPHKKSASIVGTTIALFHPHGEASVYGTLIRLSQKHKQQVVFTDPMGNWGFIDGSEAAAQRYTENRLNKLSMDLLFDGLKDNAVPFIPNFSGETEEPVVLPAKLPFALLNQQEGIAYGLAAKNITYNAAEVIDVLVGLIDGTKTEEDVYKLVPDFPTGGQLKMSLNEIITQNKKNNGKYTVRGKTSIDFENKKINILEVPFGVTSNSLIQSIIAGHTSKDEKKKIHGLIDANDLTNEEGINIELLFADGINLLAALDELYSLTPLETNLYSIWNCTNNGTFKEYNIYTIIEEWLDFRYTTKKRVLLNELSNNRQKYKLLEGVLIALADIDKVIKIVRGSDSTEDTINSLAREFKLAEIQARYIADLKLYRLNKLNINSTKEEMTKLDIRKDEILKVLSEDTIMNLIYDELKEIKNKYKFERRTTVDNSMTSVIIEDSNVYHLTLTNTRLYKDLKGRNLKHTLKTSIANANDRVLILTSKGIIHNLLVHDLADDASLEKYVGTTDTVEKIILPSEVSTVDSILIVNTKSRLTKRVHLSEILEKNQTILPSVAKDTFKYELLKDETDILFFTDSNIIRLSLTEFPIMPISSKGLAVGKKEIRDILKMESGLVLVFSNTGKMKAVDLLDPEDTVFQLSRSSSIAGRIIMSNDDNEYIVKAFEIPNEFSKLIISSKSSELTLLEENITLSRPIAKGKVLFTNGCIPNMFMNVLV